MLNGNLNSEKTSSLLKLRKDFWLSSKEVSPMCQNNSSSTKKLGRKLALMQEKKKSAEISFDSPSCTDINAINFHIGVQLNMEKKRPDIEEQSNESKSS